MSGDFYITKNRQGKEVKMVNPSDDVMEKLAFDIQKLGLTNGPEYEAAFYKLLGGLDSEVVRTIINYANSYGIHKLLSKGYVLKVSGKDENTVISIIDKKE